MRVACAFIALAAGLFGLPHDAVARTPRPHAETSAPSTPRVPRLKSISARQSQKNWMAVKGLPPARQAAAVSDRRLHEQVCADLVDMRALVESRKIEGFGFRDNVRQRTWARPSLALLLLTAMERFQAELGARKAGRGARVVSIGDVSQRGCGQLAHGVLVWTADGARREALLGAARLVAGRLVAEEIVRAADFPYEADRFGPPAERVLVEQELLGEDGDGLRYGRTRFREQAIVSGEVQAMAREVEGLVGQHRVSEAKTRSEVAPGTGDDSGERWVVHGIDTKRERQALVTLRKKPGRKLDWRDVTEVRLASWQDKKPGSLPGEHRWRVESAPEPVAVGPVRGGSGQRGRAARPAPLPADALTWSRWVLVNEAGHISHLSGIDADLSYVTTGNERHFAVDLDAMDVPLTWRWLEILEQTARELGTPLDSILVDAKVKRHLMSRLPMKGPDSVKASRVWRLLTLVGGHDAHHHIRIEEPSDALEKRARQKLGL